MYYYDDWDDFLIDLPAGQQHLDGKKAIQYVRYRDEEGDIGRIKRQQKFMMAVYEKIASAQILTKMPGLVSEIMKMVKTDLPVSDMLAMGGALHGMMKEQGGLQMLQFQVRLNILMRSATGFPILLTCASRW